MKFSKEALCGIVGLVHDSVPAAGAAPEPERIFPLRAAILVNDDPEPDAAAGNYHPDHMFVQEMPSGPMLPFVEKVITQKDCWADSKSHYRISYTF
jgi:hypothetical protein